MLPAPLGGRIDAAGYLGEAALYDPVTGLPTRRKLAEHVAGLRRRSETAAQPLALLHLDLDGFRTVNETYGRDVADRFLGHVAETLRGACGAGDMAVRSGADDFMLLIIGRSDVEEVLELAQSVQALIAARTAIEGHVLRVTASVGVAVEAPEAPVTELMTKAERALGEASRLGRGRLSLYTTDLGDRLRRRRETAEELRQALARDQIEPFFQPQIDAATGEITGFEALVRWRHPERGVLAPWQFLEIAAEAGLGAQIGAVMRAKSFRQLARWKARALGVPRIGLNFTAAELRVEGFVDTLQFDADRAGIAPGEVSVELLESAMIESQDDPVIGVLAQLSAAGFRVELDDFGTGHASISNLHRIHVDGIKIDRSFVMKLHERPEQQKLTGAMLSLAAALGIDSIAEGVETGAERELLTAMGCGKLQGYAIGRPMAGEEATLWIEHHIARAADPAAPQAPRLRA
ncbi:bifunctional diguanylate cyclase/phosphodiesterase [Limibaculum sp. FT325]|uniref:putative bifunctional diguanylate cyclase/phosphodiesterase n=1 Tax=Thermohalobaculum sediminis TaxID=2939436 RepID=UPI0020BFCD25|nr:bifunctional diguanylate cyclase/phosphodiesterase [Limibaculum sediminis]MCL5777932.1 bifunctional diguanylate cyclase/phosphodiesterase [Limibaculum sediminis]